jgi:hypothetical protein
MYKVDEMGWEIRDTIMDVIMTTINSDVTRIRA